MRAALVFVLWAMLANAAASAADSDMDVDGGDVCAMRPAAVLALLAERPSGMWIPDRVCERRGREEDLDALVAALGSERPSRAAVSLYSSTVRNGSTVGDEAAHMIEAYRRGRYPPAMPSRRYSTQDTMQMRQWWARCSPAAPSVPQRLADRHADCATAAASTTPAQPGPASHPRELILAGGSLGICSSLSPRSCAPGGKAQGPPSREAPRYSLATAMVGAGFEVALDPLLWAGREAQRDALAAVFDDLRGIYGRQTLGEDTLRRALEARCTNARGQVRSCRGTARAPWLRLDDAHRAALLAALELPQIDEDGTRRRERVALDRGRTPHGAAILRAFVAAARLRAGDAPGERPRVALVTASAFDPFDPVDFYRDALTQAGAEVEWWPVDAALAAAVFGRDGTTAQGCAALDALRRQHLRLPARGRVYPDLADEQQRACTDPERLRTLPERVQGVFFAGGDQWQLRRAFVMGDAGDARDTPNPWLHALRAAVADGRVVIGGTSAGSAVQSGGPMLSNGTPRDALRHGAIASPPPVPGCTRSGDCVGGLDEDAFTYWPGGGLGLAPGIVVDTHFSERARELRLLRLLADTGTRWGIGVDEASALHLRWQADGSVRVGALGAGGGWVFDAEPPGCMDGALQVRAWQVDGLTVRGVRLGVDGLQDATRGDAAIDGLERGQGIGRGDALEDDALRAAMRRLQAESAQAADTRSAPVDAIDLQAGKITVTLTPGATPDAAPTLRATPWPGCR